MIPIILAFSGGEMASKIERILQSGGYSVFRTCHSGAEVLRVLEQEERAILISSYRLTDLSAHELLAMTDGRVQALILLNPSQSELGTEENAVYLQSPVKRADLLASVRMMVAMGGKMQEYRHRINRLERELEERKLIERAKELLMLRYHMSEETAHRFIQKESMDNKRKMVDTAKLILEDE